MNFYAIALLAIAIGALIAARRHVRGAPIVAAIAALSACGILAVALIQRHNNSPLRLSMADETIAGEKLGQLLASNIQDGNVIVIRIPPRSEFGQEITKLRFAALAEGAKKTAIHFLQVGPNFGGLGTDDQTFTMLSEENFDAEFQKWCGAQKDIKAVVTLTGMTPPLPSGIPLYGFLETRDDEWIKSIRSGRVAAAIMCRPQPLPPETDPQQNDGLPRIYQLVTKANLEASAKSLAPLN